MRSKNGRGSSNDGTRYFANNILRLIGWIGLGAGVYGIVSHRFSIALIILAFVIGVAATTANVLRVYAEARRTRKKK